MPVFILMFASILLPVVLGELIKREVVGKEKRNQLVTGILAVEILLLTVLATQEKGRMFAFSPFKPLAVGLAVNATGLFFALLVSALWLLGGIFSFNYMQKEENQAAYYGAYLKTLGALVGLTLAQTPLTLFLFFELSTIFSVELVKHKKTEQAEKAAHAYEKYSTIGGALGIASLLALYPFIKSPYFVSGGAITGSVSAPVAVMILSFLAIVGFSAKAGLFPLHSWLPIAHPVAPAPASAALSGVITKAGILCVIRILYEYVGAAFLQGTLVQYALLSLAVLTVFMGSMMAFQQKLLKKRLAYSSVSQLSYVLCGLFLMNKTALTGGLLHVVGHALIKNGLFLCAGAIIYKTGKTRVDELKGLGRRMPITFACMTVFSLGLIGIPPTIGFVSKWLIMQGSAKSALCVFGWLVPLMLIVSAILTAAYLLPLCTRGFLGTAEEEKPDRIDLSLSQSVPLVVLAALVLLLGFYPLPLTRLFQQLSALFMP